MLKSKAYYRLEKRGNKRLQMKLKNQVPSRCWKCSVLGALGLLPDKEDNIDSSNRLVPCLVSTSSGSVFSAYTFFSEWLGYVEKDRTTFSEREG